MTFNSMQAEEAVASMDAEQPARSTVGVGFKIAVYGVGCAAAAVLVPSLLQGIANESLVTAAMLPSPVILLVSGLMGAVLLGALALALFSAIGKFAELKGNSLYADMTKTTSFGRLNRFLQATAIGSLAFSWLLFVAGWFYGYLGDLGLKVASYGGSQVALWLLGAALALALVGLAIFGTLRNLKRTASIGFFASAVLALVILILLPVIVVAALIIACAGLTFLSLAVGLVISIMILPFAIVLAKVIR